MANSLTEATDTTAGLSPVQQEPTALDALMADLGILDGRLQQAVEHVRQSMPGEADPGNRGLLIEESDVDGWLTNLGDTPPAAPEGEAGGMARLVGQAGGRIHTLAQLFDLNPLERAAILTALAPEVELDYGNLYAYVQDDVTKKYPTLNLVSALWCDTLEERLLARRVLSPESALRRHLLVTYDDSPGHNTPLLSRPFVLDPRIASYLLGGDEPDPVLAGATHMIYPERGDMQHDDPQVTALAQVASSLLPSGNDEFDVWNDEPRLRRGLTVWMRGPESRGKRGAAEHMAGLLGVHLLVIDAPQMVASVSNLRLGLQRVLREARLQGSPVFWSRADLLLARKEEGGADLGAELTRALAEWPGCAMFDLKTAPPPESSHQSHLSGGAAILELRFPAPDNVERKRLWERALDGGVPLAADVNLPLLVGAFRLTGEQIEAAADTALQNAAWRSLSHPGEPMQLTMRDLYASCRAHSNQGLGMLARKITPRYTWADLVLPADRHAQLQEMCAHIRHGPLVFETWGFENKLARGKGLNVLFAGSPGTGKTMAAEVLATDLGLELYRIDLSSVVSKYIGETEKNLEKIFSEGQTSNAILFFDEADSLFGKRSEVKDSHDRYANIEVSYLLQRMEEYDGIVILATNLRKNLDDAFMRRLHGAIDFPVPEEEDRLEIWRRTFPPEAPLASDVDLPFMARQLKLAGGNIKNIVLEAAFMAAEGGGEIRMAHLIKATRREHQKMGKLFRDSDFGPYSTLRLAEEVTSNS